MLIFTILAILYGFLSLPFFPYFIFKNLERIEEEPSKSYNPPSKAESLIVNILILTIIFALSLFFTWSIYSGSNYLQEIHVYLLPMFWPIIMQIVYASFGLAIKYLKIAIPLLVISFCLLFVIPIIDLQNPYKDPINNQSTIVETSRPLLNRDQIVQRFGITSSTEEGYDNKSKSYYYLAETKQGYGAIQVSDSIAKFFSCKYKAEPSALGNKYFGKNIVRTNIYFDKDNVYSEFALIKRDSSFFNHTLVKKIILNLTTGEISEN